MSREFLLPVRVYIEDTDAGGIVYYVNYLKYFERARTEFMRTLGYDKAAFLGGDALFVVTDVAVRYRQSARLDDLLQVSADVHAVGAATIVFAQKVHREGCCLAEGTVTIALITADTARPKRLPKALRTALVSESSEQPYSH